MDGAIEVRESLEALTVLDAMRRRTEADLDALRHRMTDVRNAIDDDGFLRRRKRQRRLSGSTSW